MKGTSIAIVKTDSILFPEVMDNNASAPGCHVSLPSHCTTNIAHAQLRQTPPPLVSPLVFRQIGDRTNCPPGLRRHPKGVVDKVLFTSGWQWLRDTNDISVRSRGRQSPKHAISSR